MASYLELNGLRFEADLVARVTVAIGVKAQVLLDDAASTVAEIDWASDALDNPSLKATQVINYVLAANKAASVSAITGASDAALQVNVDAAVDALISGGV